MAQITTTLQAFTCNNLPLLKLKLSTHECRVIYLANMAVRSVFLKTPQGGNG